MVLEPDFAKDLVSITIPKSIIDLEESNLKNALVGRFVGVRPPIELIQSWIHDRWSTKILFSIIIPNEFLIFKFQFEEDLQKVMELGPWFLGKKKD